jgi:cell division GTPase FtsZ
LEVFHLIYQNQSNVIKVIGVGGGGNAINHMFKQGIKSGVIVCNTDSQYKVVQFPIKFSWCELN